MWETTDPPIGWLATYDTQVKRAHLDRNPHCAVVTDAATKEHVWKLYSQTSPPGAGYDLGRFWRQGPTDPELHVLRLEPWRVQVVRGIDLRSRIWRAAAPAASESADG